MILSLVFLVLCLGIVVLLAKALSPSIEKMVIDIGAPKSLVGVIIAAVVLLPEGISAIKAARKNQLQTSLNGIRIGVGQYRFNYSCGCCGMPDV